MIVDYFSKLSYKYPAVAGQFVNLFKSPLPAVLALLPLMSVATEASNEARTPTVVCKALIASPAFPQTAISKAKDGAREQINVALNLTRASYQPATTPLAEDLSSFGVKAIHLAWIDEVEFIYEKHIHVFIKKLEGFHVVLTFKNNEERKSFLEAGRVEVFEANAQWHRKNLPAVLLTTENYAALLKSAISTNNPVKASAAKQTLPPHETTETQLQARASSSLRTPGGTTYYFQGNQPIGFSTRDGEGFELTAIEPLGFSTHQEILRRQGVETGPPSNAPDSRLVEIQQGRKAVDDSAAELSFQLPRGTLDWRAARFRHLAASGDPTKILHSFAVDSLDQIQRSLRNARPEQVRGNVADGLLHISKTFPKTNRPGTRFYRFIWFKSAASEPRILFETKNILHDQIVYSLVGDLISQDALAFQALQKGIRGGVIQARYEVSGKLSEINLVARTASFLSITGDLVSVEMSAQEAELLLAHLRRQ